MAAIPDLDRRIKDGSTSEAALKQNINVFLRIRPLNGREISAGATEDEVVSCSR